MATIKSFLDDCHVLFYSLSLPEDRLGFAFRLLNILIPVLMIISCAGHIWFSTILLEQGRPYLTLDLVPFVFHVNDFLCLIVIMFSAYTFLNYINKVRLKILLPSWIFVNAALMFILTSSLIFRIYIIAISIIHIVISSTKRFQL